MHPTRYIEKMQLPYSLAGVRTVHRITRDYSATFEISSSLGGRRKTGAEIDWVSDYEKIDLIYAPDVPHVCTDISILNSFKLLKNPSFCRVIRSANKLGTDSFFFSCAKTIPGDREQRSMRSSNGSGMHACLVNAWSSCD